MDTRSVLNRMLEHTEAAANQITIDFRLSDDLRQKFAPCQGKRIFTPLKDNENTTINKLRHSYDIACEQAAAQAIDNEFKLLLEEYKLRIMEAVLASLEMQSNNQREDNQEENNIEEETLKLKIYQLLLKAMSMFTEDEEKKKKILRDIWYGMRMGGFVLFGILGLVLSGIDNFLGLNSMLPMIFSGIASPVLLGITMTLTAFSSILYVAFEASMIKDMFGVTFGKTDFICYLELQEKQIRTAKKINSLLLDVTNHGQWQDEGNLDVKINAYGSAALLFNKTINSQREKLKNYNEGWLRKGLRYFVTAFGAVMTASMGYFLGIQILGALAAGLIGTPAGWAIIGIVMVSILVMYLAMEGSALTAFFNPAMELFNHVKGKMEKFDSTRIDVYLNNKLNDNIESGMSSQAHKSGKLTDREASFEQQPSSVAGNPSSLYGTSRRRSTSVPESYIYKSQLGSK